MKKTLLFLSFLLFNSLLSLAAEEPNPVLDTDGKKLRAGVEYYILPVLRGFGGGLTLANIGNKTEICPLGVVQEQLEVKRGLPLTFRPVNPKKGVVRVTTDLNIKFSASTICIQSNVWKLDFDEAIGQYVIVGNGVEGNPGRETLSNWFKIEKYNDRDYKLVFCPTVCRFCRVICRDVGIFIHDKKRILALSDKPFRVIFKKA